MRVPRTLLRLSVTLILCLLCAASQAIEWPHPSWPVGSQAELVAADAVLNGRRSRIWQAQLSVSRAEAERFFQTQWGPKLARDQVRGHVVLGSRQGDHFLTVQLKEQLGKVTAQLIATTLSEQPSRSRALQDTLSWLPGGVGVLQTLESNDGGRRGLTVTAVSNASVEQLGEDLGLHLRRRGWTPHRESLAKGSGRQGQRINAQGGGEDILIAISDLGERRSIVIQRNKEFQP